MAHYSPLITQASVSALDLGCVVNLGESYGALHSVLSIGIGAKILDKQIDRQYGEMGI